MQFFSHQSHVASNRTGLFGSTYSIEEADLIILPVSWEVTVPTRSGTALGPETILKASYQLETCPLEDSNNQPFRVAMLPISHEWKVLSDMLRHEAAGYIHAVELGVKQSTLPKNTLQKINGQTRLFQEELKHKITTYLQYGKLVAVLGGEHIVALGLIEALAEQYEHFGILHINAHAALQKSYLGFTYSHATLMHHVLKLPQVDKIVQVGLRNYNKEEAQAIINAKGRITTFLDSNLKEEQYQGTTWHTSCEKIIGALPQQVYISFDIDGLNPSLCPSTGRPVPGGLNFNEVKYLLKCLVNAGKQVIGFDLCEVSPGEHLDWDAQVGSRILYQLAVTTLTSQPNITS